MYGSLGLSESIPQNDISIGSAVLAQFMVMFNSHRATDTHTDHRTLAIPCVRWGLKLITSCYRIGSDSSHCGGVTPLLRASGYVRRERRFDPSIIQQVSGTCPRCVSYSCEIRAPSNTCGPKSDPNCISIGSAAFAGFTVATNGHTDNATSSVAIVCITATRAMQANNYYWQHCGLQSEFRCLQITLRSTLWFSRRDVAPMTVVSWHSFLVPKYMGQFVRRIIARRSMLCHHRPISPTIFLEKLL